MIPVVPDGGSGRDGPAGRVCGERGDGMSERLDQLRDWLADLAEVDGTVRLETASEDASFRRYFRVFHDGPPMVVMDAPPEKEDCGPFVRVDRMLRDAGVHAPRLHAQDLERGFLLLEDLGNTTYLEALRHDADPDPLYRRAIEALVAMQSGIDCGATPLPPFSRDRLMEEMALFRDWFLGSHLGLRLTPDIVRTLEQVFEYLAGESLVQPQYFVHRDYHSRNLMVLEGEPGVLDFQDAVAGPVSYDLVSLLRDCYIAWPADRVEGWVRVYRERAEAAGIDVGPDHETFVHWFNLTGIQRHLKAIGIFSRLYHRDGKPGYLGDIPRTLRYIALNAPAYPVLQEFALYLSNTVVPRLRDVQEAARA